MAGVKKLYKEKMGQLDGPKKAYGAVKGGSKQSSRKALQRAVAERKNAVITGRMSLKEYLGGDRPKQATRKGAGGKTAQ